MIIQIEWIVEVLFYLSDLTLKLWAKTNPYHPLYCHMIDTGYVAGVLLKTVIYEVVARKFSKSSGLPQNAVINWLMYLAALHDIGKCRADFEGKGPDSLIEPLIQMGLDCRRLQDKFRHEAFSAQWLLEFFEESFQWRKPEARTIATCMRGHHGNFKAEYPVDEHPALQKQWNPLRVELEKMSREVFKPAPWNPEFSDHSTIGILLSGLIVLSDWIASNPQLFLMEHGDRRPVEYSKVSRERAEKAVASVRLDDDLRWTSRNQTFREIWPGIAVPRPIQAHCEQLCLEEKIKPGMAIIEAPMGEGKTEAAVYLATRWMAETGSSGIYIALPTAATSNQMYGRFRDFLTIHDREAARKVKLVHGTAWLLDEDAPDSLPELSGDSSLEAAQVLDWFRPKKRGLLAAYGVGTIDQALMSVLQVKHGFLRLFGLAGKVLIVDEVHAYDAYMSQILIRLLQWCGAMEIPVILLSATLPEIRRRQLTGAYLRKEDFYDLNQRQGLAPYPLLTFAAKNLETIEAQVAGSAKRQNIILMKQYETLGKSESIARLVWDRAVGGGCLAVIANTVDSAQDIYLKLKELAEKSAIEVNLFLFHARFPMERRQQIENLTLELFDKRSLLGEGDPNRTKRPKRAILVATQVVEQSLDLDFDELFTEIAPIDLLLQRCGRLHRHDRPERPTGSEARLHLILPESGPPDFLATEYVYSRFILLKTLAVLDETAVFTLPRMIRDLVERVYNDTFTPDNITKITDADDFQKVRMEFDREIDDEVGEALKFLIPNPSTSAFKLDRTAAILFDEDEGDTTSYFTAKTRLGDETAPYLILDETMYQKELSGVKPPGNQTLKEIYRHAVNLRSYWFKGLEPAHGFTQPEKAPDWLPGIRTLRMKEGIWRGVDAKGVQNTIRYDQNLGIVREVKKGV